MRCSMLSGITPSPYTRNLVLPFVYREVPKSCTRLSLGRSNSCCVVMAGSNKRPRGDPGSSVLKPSSLVSMHAHESRRCAQTASPSRRLSSDLRSPPASSGSRLGSQRFLSTACLSEAGGRERHETHPPGPRNRAYETSLEASTRAALLAESCPSLCLANGGT